MAKTHFSSLANPEPKRSHFIARVGAWHGATLGALTLGDFKVRKDPFLSLIAQTTSRVSACNTYRDLQRDENKESYVRRLAQELDDEFQRIGPEKVCAFVAETVGGSVSFGSFFSIALSMTLILCRQVGAQCLSKATFQP